MYTPGALPKEAPAWITRELLAISEAAVANVPTVTYDATAVEPTRPREGQFYLADGTNWDPGYGPGPYIYFNDVWFPMFGASITPTEAVIVACSDETTALTTGVAKVTFRMPYAFTLGAVRASLTTAPTGATLVVDINQNGSTILSTKLSIDTTEKTSYTAATPAVISVTSLAIDAEITIDIDQVGSTIAGAGLKVILIGARVA